MEKRGSYFPGVRSSLLIAFLVLGNLETYAGPNGLSRYLEGAISTPQEKIVTVLALADACFQNDESWKIEINHALMHVSPIIEKITGVKLRIKDYGYWIPCPGEPGRTAGATTRPLTAFLSLLRTQLSLAGRRPCDVVIALASAESDEPAKGIADYLGGIVVLKHLKENEGLTYVLLHELCHLFGAVDRGASNSVMSRLKPSFRIDSFTRDIMRINAQRSFRSGERPLPENCLIEAIALYKRSQNLDLDRTEVAICIDGLQAMIADRRKVP